MSARFELIEPNDVVGVAVDRNGVPFGVLFDAANVGEADLSSRVLQHISEEVELADEELVVTARDGC